MLLLLSTVFRTPSGWLAIGLIVAVVVTTVAEVLLVLRLANWNADFFNVLERKSLPGLVTQSWIFVIIVAGIMSLQAASLETKMRLQILLRTHLTELVSHAWMSDGRHYRLRSTGGRHDNEDGRIAEDGRVVCEMVVEFLNSLLYAFLQLTLFIGVLWLHSGPLTLVVGTTTITVPGHMVWIALLYAGLGAAITLFVGRPLVHATDQRQAAEAAYRARLVNGLVHSPAIALTGAEPGERRRLALAFDDIRLAWTAQKTSFRNLLFLSSGYGHLTAVLPLLILAPRYFSGEMSLGTLMQVTIAFGQVTAALSWLSGNYPSIAQWEASAERVLALYETLGDLGRDDCADAGGRLLRVSENGPNLTFDNLSLISSDGEVLVEHFSAGIKPGERVLVEATPQAAEGLFRAVGGLSLWGAGRIELPENSMPYFMSDHPYLPETTLIEALLEPQLADHIAKGEVSQALVDVGLAQLVPLLHTTAQWEQELGIEDQQRLGFARVLLHKPSWILMHDATSALDAVAEDRLIEILTRSLPNSALVTITHRAVTKQRFQRHISLSTAAPDAAKAPQEARSRAAVLGVA